ncbi:MAG: SBBP repeat-containing protein, partial [Candidatus Zixiibacteriota bacterium]
MKVFSLIFAGIMLFLSAGFAQDQIDPEWVYRWQFSPGESESGDAIAADPFGNIYVAGHTDTLSPHDDWVILRLNNSGDSLWTAFYDSPLDGIDTPE